MGPRSKKQYAALAARLGGRGADVQAEVNAKYVIAQPDCVLHVVHAMAQYIAANVLAPTSVATFLQFPASARKLFTAECRRNAYVRTLVDVVGPPKQQTVCAKNSLGAHDIDSLEAAVLAAGLSGVCRQEIGGQYKDAYMDLERLCKERVFSTTYRVWHRSVAPKGNKALRRQAEDAGLIERV